MEGLSCKAVLLYVRLAVIFGLHALFVALTLARGLSSDATDGSWNWYVVFAPLFLFDAISVVYWAIYLVSYIATKLDEDSAWSDRSLTLFPGQKLSLVPLLAHAVAFSLKVTAEILVLLRLQDVSNVSVLAPAVLLMVLFAGVGVLSLVRAMTPMLTMWTSRSTPFHGNSCLGYLDRCFRRCLYLVCIACMN